MDADTKHYVCHLKIGRTSMICGRLLTSVSQNFDVSSTFCRRNYIGLEVIQNTVLNPLKLKDRCWNTNKTLSDCSANTAFYSTWHRIRQNAKILTTSSTQ